MTDRSEVDERLPSHTEDEDNTTTTDTTFTTGADKTDTHTASTTHTKRSFFNLPPSKLISEKWFSRRRVLLIGLAVMTLLLADRVGACGPPSPPKGVSVQQLEAFARLNAFRDDFAPALYPTGELMDKAQAWSEHMANDGKLSHSNLSDGIAPGWSSLAENVAVASSLAEVQAALENSPPHRANMVSTKLSEGGIGVAERNGQFYVTQSFLGR